MPDHFHANFCEQMTNTYPQIPEISEDNIKILLIEDDETDARLVKIYAGAIPNAQIIVDWVKSTSEAREKLQSGHYDLCIFDFCLRIVEIHGGRIWFDTDVSSGSRVCFTLPLPSKRTPA